MYIDWNNILRQIEIAQRALDSINYIDLTKTLHNASRIHQENRKVFETWNNISSNMVKNFEISIPNIVKVADLYNNTLKNINPSLVSVPNYNTIIDTTKIFNKIEINIKNNNLNNIITDLNYYKEDLGLEIDDIGTIINDDFTLEDNLIDNIIDKLLPLKKEKQIVILGALFSLLLLIKNNGTFPEETVAYLDDWIDSVFWLLIGVLYNRFVK